LPGAKEKLMRERRSVGGNIAAEAERDALNVPWGHWESMRRGKRGEAPPPDVGG